MEFLLLASTPVPKRKQVPLAAGGSDSQETALPSAVGDFAAKAARKDL